MEFKELDVLVIAPHPDDAELGMGGGIQSMQASGQRVGVLDLTNGEPTPHGSTELRAAETQAATEILGLAWRGNLGLENRRLQPTLNARAALAGVIRQTRPRWLFAPFWQDAHPDHLAATQLVDDARFWAKLSKTDMPGDPHHPERIFNYYCVHLKLHGQPAFVLDISDYWVTSANVSIILLRTVSNFGVSAPIKTSRADRSVCLPNNISSPLTTGIISSVMPSVFSSWSRSSTINAFLGAGPSPNGSSSGA